MENVTRTFVEVGVGASDTLLSLAAGGWRGYCVEPIPRLAAALRKEAKGLPVEVIEMAISDHDGTVGMAVSTGSGWMEGISHVTSSNHRGGRLLDHPANRPFRGGDIEVSCLTMDSFLDQYGIDEVDLMKVDVEGHELNVFDGYSWRVKPLFIKAEHKHVQGDSLDVILAAAGYHIWSERDDLYAVLVDGGDK